LYPLKNEEKYFLDKTPRYYYIFEELSEMFPDAKFIILKRDIFAVLYSMLSTWVNSNTDLGSLSRIYRDFLTAPKIIDQIWKNSDQKNNCYRLKYEDLLDDPKNVSKDLYQWLNLPFDESVLNLDRNKKTSGVFGDDIYRDKPSGMIDASEKSKWKNVVESDKHLKLFFKEYSDYLGDAFIREYGYEPFSPSIGSKRFWRKSDFSRLIEIYRNNL
jgi:hypothetical protein